tara:strand:- start:489 stop:1193 length:705 start_codon:yes stop_codon:yes gene_type:complete
MQPKILGVILAREGSKEIKLKNLIKINNISLIKRTIFIAQKSKLIDKLILSTESHKIISHVKDTNIEVPFIRSKKLATDKAKTFDVIRDALQKSEKKYNIEFDLIIILQPTTPFRKTKTIDMAIKKLMKFNADVCMSIIKTPYPPEWAIEKNKNNRLKHLFKIGKNITRRQDFKPSYYPSGAIYILKKDSLLKQNSILPNTNTIGIEVDHIEGINIDNQTQLEYAKYIAKKYKI